MFDYVSDLHLDNAMSGGPHGWLGTTDFTRYKNDGSKYLIVAGDTSNHINDTVDALSSAAKIYDHVVAIPGNHEKDGIFSTPDNLHILKNEHCLLGGNLFVGGELRYSKNIDHIFGIIRNLQLNEDVRRIILISHYAPSIRLGEILGCDMTNHSNNLLEHCQGIPKITDIVFGHLHIPCDMKMDGIALRSNPRGYRGKLRNAKNWLGRCANFV